MCAPMNCIPAVHTPATPTLINPDPSDATPNTPMLANFDGTLVECTTCTHIASTNPDPSPYSWEPAQLCLQHLPHQLCMNCMISQLFAWAHKIPGTV